MTGEPVFTPEQERRILEIIQRYERRPQRIERIPDTQFVRLVKDEAEVVEFVLDQPDRAGVEEHNVGTV